MSYDGAVYIEKDEAEKILNSSEYWIRLDGKYAEEVILYKGQLRILCRTDECDDVCTTCCVTIQTAEKRGGINYWKRKLKRSYGVRLGPARFAIIDSMTDG